MSCCSGQHVGFMGFDHMTNLYLYPDIHPKMSPYIYFLYICIHFSRVLNINLSKYSAKSNAFPKSKKVVLRLHYLISSNLRHIIRVFSSICRPLIYFTEVNQTVHYVCIVCMLYFFFSYFTLLVVLFDRCWFILKI